MTEDRATLYEMLNRAGLLEGPPPKIEWLIMPDYTTKEAADYLTERGFTVRSHRQKGISSAPTAHTLKQWCADGKIEGARKEGSKYRGEWMIPQEALDKLIERSKVMPTYETRATGVKDQTEVFVRTGIVKVPAGWQNMTAEKAASYPFIAGYVSRNGRHWHATSMAVQAFRRPEWTQNEGRDFDSEQEALDWVIARCNEELAAL